MNMFLLWVFFYMDQLKVVILLKYIESVQKISAVIVGETRGSVEVIIAVIGRL